MKISKQFRLQYIIDMEQKKLSEKVFRPFKLEDSYALTPDNPDFYNFDVNLAILTKYGRGVYIRHGNEDRCSSFFATLGTIINKLELSFGHMNEGREEPEPATLKYIRQGPLRLYVLRRLNFMYICWSKSHQSEVTLYGMIEFVHQQLMSCLTGKVNSILDSNQTYDPSVNFGKTRTEHLLLHYAFTNGLYSIPIAFNAIPVMPLPSQSKNALSSMLREQKIEGLQINILMTMQQVVCIHKQKGIDLTTYDIFLLNSLIQSQSSFFNSQIWYPICLPGVCFEDRVFCYINFLTDQLIHIMVSDEANIFKELSQASKRLKQRLSEGPLMERIHFGCNKELISDPTLEKSIFLKHFVIRYSPIDQNSLSQLVMSSGSYFGVNQNEMLKNMRYYGELHRYFSTHKGSKKEKVHIQPLGQLMGGYFQEGNIAIFFVGSKLCELEDCRQIGAYLSRYVKEEEGNLWLQKIT